LEVEVVVKIELIQLRYSWEHLADQVVAEGRPLLDLQLLPAELARLDKVLLEEQGNMFLQVGQQVVVEVGLQQLAFLLLL
jgi:hypothetical protein